MNPRFLPEDDPIGEYRQRTRASHRCDGAFYGDGDEHDAR